MGTSQTDQLEDTIANRCRLVLFVPAEEGAADRLQEAMSGGDVASVILTAGNMNEAEFLAHVQGLTPIAQEQGAAVIVTGDSQAMGRAGADGIFITGGKAELDDAIARFSPKRIVGCGGIKNRHQAMELAEAGPDFLYIGKPDGDIRPEAHPKNVKLGQWCAEVMQLSVIVMGGNAVECVIEVAESGVEFVALSKAVFDHPKGVAFAVSEANRLLDTHAPQFEDDEA